MTDTVQSSRRATGHTCTLPLCAGTSALSDIPPFGDAAAMSPIVLDEKTAFASFHPVVNDVKKGQSGDVYY
jgi:hypothetical protein